MITIDQLRSEQERRLLVALESLKEAKKHLENIRAIVEAREREFLQASEEVQRKIEALELVSGMAGELDEEVPPTERRLKAVGNRPVERDVPLIAKKALAAMDRILGGESSRQNQAA